MKLIFRCERVVGDFYYTCIGGCGKWVLAYTYVLDDTSRLGYRDLCDECIEAASLSDTLIYYEHDTPMQRYTFYITDIAKYIYATSLPDVPTVKKI